MCIGFSAYITGVFGMNLDNTNTIQQQQGLFAAVVGATFALIVVGIGLIISYYRSQGVLPTKVKIRPSPDVSYYESISGSSGGGSGGGSGVDSSTTSTRRATNLRSYCPSPGGLFQRRKGNSGLSGRGSVARAPLGVPLPPSLHRMLYAVCPLACYAY